MHIFFKPLNSIFWILSLVIICASTANAAEKSLTFTSYGSAYEQAQKKAWLEPFAQSHNVTIHTDAPTSYAKIKAMVESGHVAWDVVDTEPFFPAANCGKYVEKLDFSIIDTSNIPSEMVGKCYVPDALYSLVLVYNKKKYGSNPPQSFKDFFNTKKFPGTRMLPGFVTGGPLEVALLGAGVDPKHLYPLDYKRAFKSLNSIRDQLVFWDTSAESQAKVENSQVDMAVLWSGRAYEAISHGAPYAPVWKHTLLAYATLSIPKGAHNKKLAMQLINYAISAKGQADFSELIPYSPVNTKADPNLSSLADRFNVARSEIRDQAVIYNTEWWAKNYKKATKKWLKWKIK